MNVEVRIGSGDILRGDFRPGDDSGGMAVLYIHGFGSRRDGEKSVALAAACACRRWTFAAFDFRGHGSSDGAPRELTATRLIEDLSAIHAFLFARDHPRHGLVGSSMGAFAAAWFAIHHPEAVAGCVLLAPAFRFLERRWEEITEPERQEWARTGLRRVRNEWVDMEIGYALVEERAAFDPTDLARRWRTPLLIYQGLADDVVPATESIAFVDSTKYPNVELRLLKAGDHRLTTFKDEIADAACRFLESYR
jgi:uncharacterized protein